MKKAYLSKNDRFKVLLGSMLASYDKDILVMLYQPLIGHVAISLYFTLWGEFKKSSYKEIFTHDELCVDMGIKVPVLIVDGRRRQRFSHFRFIIVAGHQEKGGRSATHHEKSFHSEACFIY